MITPLQIRAARALIGWTQKDLAAASGISAMSIKNLERGVTDPRATTVQAIRSALEEKGGIKFIKNGVQLKSSRQFMREALAADLDTLASSTEVGCWQFRQ